MDSLHQFCPKCDHSKVVKNGLITGKQRYKCKACNYQFTTSQLERGKPQWMKLEAVLLYTSGLSMNAIAHLLRVSAQSVLNWIREFGQENCEKPEPDKVVVIEIDEFWHYIGSKKTSCGYGKHMTVIMGDLLTGNWEVVIVKP